MQAYNMPTMLGAKRVNVPKIVFINKQIFKAKGKTIDYHEKKHSNGGKR